MGVKNLFNLPAFIKAIEKGPLDEKAIAEKIGCYVNDIYRYKRGEALPRMSRLKKLVELLGPSITGLTVTTDEKSTSKFTAEERRYFAWFRSLPPFRQARILGYTEAVYEFGNDADGEFAADFAGQLILAEQQQKEQPG